MFIFFLTTFFNVQSLYGTIVFSRFNVIRQRCHLAGRTVRGSPLHSIRLERVVWCVCVCVPTQIDNSSRRGSNLFGMWVIIPTWRPEEVLDLSPETLKKYCNSRAYKSTLPLIGVSRLSRHLFIRFLQPKGQEIRICRKNCSKTHFFMNESPKRGNFR